MTDAVPPIEGPTLHAKCHVVVTVFDLKDDARPGRCVTADKMVELIRKEVMKQAHPSVRRGVNFTFKPSDTGKPPLLDMRAKVEMSAHITGIPGFAAVSTEAQRFMFQLRDDIIEIIENIEPPKSAWVLDFIRPKALKGPSSDRPDPISRPDQPVRRESRTAGKRSRRTQPVRRESRTAGKRSRRTPQPH